MYDGINNQLSLSRPLWALERPSTDLAIAIPAGLEWKAVGILGRLSWASELRTGQKRSQIGGD